MIPLNYPKVAANNHVQRNLDRQQGELIERALNWQADMPSYRLNEALDFIRYTVERSQQFD
jgi:hypothetical protein